MKLKEKLASENIFTHLGDFPFVVGNEELLNQILVSYHGERKLFTTLEDTPLTVLAGMIELELGDGWHKLIDLDILAGDLADVVEVTESVNETETKTGSSDTVNKVAAFNDPLMVDNDGSNSTSSDDVSGEKTKTSTQRNIKAKQAYDVLSSSQKHSIISEVVKDISCYLTLAIY